MEKLFKNLINAIKAEDAASIREYKAFKKIDKELKRKFMWDLKIIDKFSISLDPWCNAIDICTDRRFNKGEQFIDSKEIGNYKVKVRFLADFKKVRPDFENEIYKWAEQNIIKYMEA